MGWGKAAVISVVALAAAVLLLVFAPDAILTRFTGLGRSTRVAVATAWFFVALAALAWAMRRLQAHHVV